MWSMVNKMVHIMAIPLTCYINASRAFPKKVPSETMEAFKIY